MKWLDGRLVLGAALLGACGSLPASAQDDPAQRALSLQRQGKISEAEAEWKELAQQHPTSPEPLAELGLLEARQEHYAKAIAWYKKALALNPTLPGLRLNLGLAYFKAADYPAALEELEPLLKAQPNDQQLTILVGMTHYGLGQFAAASPLLKQAADQDPQNLTLLLTLAHSCLLSSQYPCVLDAYHRILALNSESAEADMLVGEALDEMKDTEGAIREFRSAEAVNPKEPNVHFGLGYLLWKRNDYTDAAPEFRREIEDDPQHFQAMLYLADSDVQMNSLDEAKNLLEKLKGINTNSYKEHLDLGIVYSDEGKNQAALAEFQRAIKLDPSEPSAHWRMGRLYKSMGRTAEAKAEFEKTKNMNKAEDDRLLKIMVTIPDKQDAGSSKPEQPNQ